ncbi:MAG: DUF1489 domain-containing protein [Parvularculaceae bacterium]
MKLCVGADSVETLELRNARRIALSREVGLGKTAEITTRMFPRRHEEIVDGGSLYWVVKGVMLIRQRIISLEPRRGEDGVERCAIIMDGDLVPTEAQPRRAFQGWRYLNEADAPVDIKYRDRKTPPALRAQLAELGLL